MPEGTAEFSIRYFGDTTPAAIEAQELIRVLSSFTKLSIKASRTIYGSDNRASFRISHVRPGTIDIGGLIELLAGLQPGFAMLPSLSLGVEDVAQLLKSWLDLLKFLKGQPPKIVQTVTSGNAVQVENANGDVQIVNGNVYNTFVFNDIGRDASKLEIPVRYGAKRLDLFKGSKRIGSYSAEDVSQFRPIRPADDPIVSEIDAILEVIAPVFEGEGVWRFRYGRMALIARLVDEDYRSRVVEGAESFRHGDRLRARLKTVQEKVGDKVVTKHVVTKVLGRI